MIFSALYEASPTARKHSRCCTTPLDHFKPSYLAVRGPPQSSLLQKGVRCETRQLPLGDMLWIARRRDDPTSEVLLGYIVERKTASDLASSIIDGR